MSLRLSLRSYPSGSTAEDGSNNADLEALADAAWLSLWDDLANGEGDDEALILACERWRRAAEGERHGFRYRIRSVFNKQTAQYKRLTNAIRSGVPSTLRGQVWYVCSGGVTKSRAPCKEGASRSYGELVEAGKSSRDTEAARVIAADLSRTGVEDESLLASLENVLFAFATKNPHIGYCQSMNFIAAAFLAYAEEEHAFWMLCSVVEDMLPEGYYSPTLTGLRVDLKVFDSLVAQYLPTLHRHLREKELDLSPIIMNWFLCLFVNTLPPAYSGRVLDCLLHEGSKVLFRTGLSVLRIRQAELLQTSGVTDCYMLLRLPFGGGEDDDGSSGFNVSGVSPADFMGNVHGNWLLGFKSETLQKLRAEQQAIVKAEDARVEAQREQLRKRREARVAVEAQADVTEFEAGCPAQQLNKSFAALSELPAVPVASFAARELGRGRSGSCVSIAASNGQANGVHKEWDDGELSDDEVSSTAEASTAEASFGGQREDSSQSVT